VFGGGVPIRAAVDDAAPRRGGIAASGSFPSGGAPTVTLPALDAPGVSAASSAACAGTRRSVCVFRRLLAAHAPRGTSGRPNAPFSLCGGEELEESHRGKFLGKPRRAISRFRQQDAQIPPAPRVEAEGGGIVQDRNAPLARCARLRRARGRDARAPGATLRRTPLQGQVWWQAPACLRGARASGAHAGGTPAHPAQPSGACFCRGRFGGKPRRAISRFRQQDAQTPPSPRVEKGAGGIAQERIFWQAPACHLSFQAAGRPDSPFSPCGRRGQGG
jgi:hypothetical protein